MNRKTLPREKKMREDLTLLSKAILKQQDYIVEVATENELLKQDKLELLKRLEEANKLVSKLENNELDMVEQLQNLQNFKNRAIPMLETYFDLL